MEAIFINLIIFGSITIIVLKIAQQNHDFKLKLLESGLTGEQFKALLPTNKGIKYFFNINPLRNMQVGILSFSVGIGIICGLVIHNVIGRDADATMSASILISCGIGLIVFYFISKKKMTN